MKIGVISAMEEEATFLQSQLENVEKIEINKRPYWTGRLNNLDVVLCVSGVGKVNSAITTQILVDKFNVDGIINSGIAGSLSSDVKSLDIVVSDKLLYHDFHFLEFEHNYPYVPYFTASKEYIDRFLEANKEEGNIHVGTIATGDLFVDKQDVKEDIARRTGGIACEMEGCSIAHTSFVNGKPFVVFRCISDSADENANMSFDEFIHVASDKIGKMVLRFLKSF